MHGMMAGPGRDFSESGKPNCLGELLAYLKNWFVVPDGIHAGKFSVSVYGISEVSEEPDETPDMEPETPPPAALTRRDMRTRLPFLQHGQYFRIVGSVLNDGVYQYGDALGLDETFEGAVWALAIPNDVIRLAREIDRWQAENGDAAVNGIVSESFGGYSYTRAAGTTSWKTVFRDRLSVWRKI